MANSQLENAKAKPKLSLILGGVRSGKSEHAEKLALAWKNEAVERRGLIYLATAIGLDQSMKARIITHQARRDENWKTIEAPIHLAKAITACGRNQTLSENLILVDCLTLYITNHLMQNPNIVEAENILLLQALAARQNPIILVSNENNMGLHGESRLSRDFQDQIGKLHQAIANIADEVILVVAGQPLKIK